MKYLLSSLLLALSLNICAEPRIDVALLSGEDGHVYVDIGSKTTKVELLFAYEPSLSIKHSFSLTDKLNLWAGAGFLGVNQRFQDSFGNNGADSNYFPVIFLELEHDSGVFVRAYHYEGTASTTIHHNHLEKVNGTIVRNEGDESFSTDISENKVFVGYKWKF